ncbi:hypothetical protein OSB04_011865 [Centaurea solstitialis]|uniref:Uncharacterized protein n=1 Tax=Centaurea solstitialis TaxID=347529 RepID=A0AA38TNC7_9ASTR|nr:hypothetical protein OSB04_011865 [Centaurea solstitialis]
MVVFLDNIRLNFYQEPSTSLSRNSCNATPRFSTLLDNVSRLAAPLFFCNQILDFSNNKSIAHGTSSVPEISIYGQEEKFLPLVQNLVQPTTSLVHHCNSNFHMPDLEFSDPDELPMELHSRIKELRVSWNKMETILKFKRLLSLPLMEINKILFSYQPMGMIKNYGFRDPELQMHLADYKNIANFTNTLS